MRIGRPPPERQSPWAYLIVAAVAAVAGFFLIGQEDPPPETAATAGIATGTAEVIPGAPAAPVVPRCKSHGPPMGYAVGERSSAETPETDAPLPPASGGPPDPEEAPSEPPLLPFSVAIGRGVALESGSFAVGVKRDRDGGSWAEVAIVDDRAASGRLVSLARSRGDVDAPLVVRRKDDWVASLLEPNAGGLDLRLVAPDGDGGLVWGATLPQGRDESLAYDVVFGNDGGLVAWDEVVDDGAQAVVKVAAVDAGLKAVGKPTTRSREDVDAELPRLLPRGDGFWLFYVARAPIEEAGERTEGRFAAERIVPSWLEVVPLDGTGVPTGSPISVTGQGDHVLAFDVAMAKDGQALVIWRDDDTPSGAHGGDVYTVLVGGSGPGAVQPVTSEKVGAGVPDLIGGFVALHDAQGQLQLAPADSAGVLTGLLQTEPKLGPGQLVAASNNILLVARPSGRALELFTVSCDRRVNTLPSE